MNILLTGGTGLIGKALVEQLCLRNEQVTVLTRSSTPPTISKQKKHQIYYCTFPTQFAGAV